MSDSGQGTVRRASPGAAPLAAALALLPMLAGAGWLAAQPSSDEGVPRLERLNAALAAQAELAASDEAYLVLDLERRRLLLMHGGAILRVYPILRAEIGTAQVAFLERTADAWGQGPHAGADLLPARQIRRVEIKPVPSVDLDAVAGDAADEQPVEIPPTPEEACPAPARYVVRYDDGFGLEVRHGSSDPRTFLTRLGSALRMKGAAILSALGGGRPRIRVTLAPEDAGALYRSFPTESGLLVL